MWRRRRFLAEAVPWRHFVGASTVQNEDRSLTRIFSTRGPDLTGLSTAEIGSYALRFNNALKGIPGQWSIHSEHVRARIRTYRDATCTHPVLVAFDRSRKQAILEKPSYENRYFLAIRCQPQVTAWNQLGNAVMTRPASDTTDSLVDQVRRFVQQTNHLMTLMGGVLATCAPLTDDEVAQYLNAAATGEWLPIRMPKHDPMDLNWKFCTQPFYGGWEPRLGSKYLAFASVTMYPDMSLHAMWETLDHLPMESRRVVRWIAHPRQVSRGMLKRIETRHHADQTTVWQEIGRQFGMQPAVTDTYEALLADDTSKARQEVSGNIVAYGHFSPYFMTWGETYQEAQDHLARIVATLEDTGCKVVIEGEGTREAFLAMQPGDVRHGFRRHLLSSLNVAHLQPTASASWEGPAFDEHLQAPPWMLGHTEGSTLIRIVNHTFKDVGHVALLGPTGTGKSTKLGVAQLSWLAQYHETHGARGVTVDIGRAGRALNLCLGGRYDDLEQRQPLYQPLRWIDHLEYFDWAYEWLLGIMERYKIPDTSINRTYLRAALQHLAKMPPDERTWASLDVLMTRASNRSQSGWSGLASGSEMQRALVQDRMMAVLDDQKRIRDMIRDIDHYRLLSASEDTWTDTLLHTIELGSLLRQPRLASIVMPYLGKRLRMTFTGEPVLYQVDEDALILTLPTTEDEQMDDLRSLRKLNVSLMVASQSLSDVTESRVGTLIIESCQTMILLANPAALDHRIAEIYRDLSCSDTEIRDIATMAPQGEYYLRTTYRNRPRRRKYQLPLSGLALALCGSSSDEDHELMDKLLLQYAPGPEFAVAFCQAKGVPDEEVAWLVSAQSAARAADRD